MPGSPFFPRRDQRHVLSLNCSDFGSLLEGGPEACPGSTFRSFSQLQDFYVQGRPFVGPSKIREALQGPVLLSLLQIRRGCCPTSVRGGVPIFREGRPELAMLRPSQVEKIAQNRLEAPYRMEFCSLSSTKLSWRCHQCTPCGLPNFRIERADLSRLWPPQSGQIRAKNSLGGHTLQTPIFGPS